VGEFSRRPCRRKVGFVSRTVGESCGPDFFVGHTLTELEGWSDHALEEVGRLTEAMRYDQETDKYLPVG